jgi:hypothetical protein
MPGAGQWILLEKKENSGASLHFRNENEPDKITGDRGYKSARDVAWRKTDMTRM